MNPSHRKRPPHPEDVDMNRPPDIGGDLARELKRRSADELVAQGVTPETLLWVALRDTALSAQAMSRRRAVFEPEEERDEHDQQTVLSLWRRLGDSVASLADVLATLTGEPVPEALLVEDPPEAEVYLLDPEEFEGCTTGHKSAIEAMRVQQDKRRHRISLP